MKYALSTLAFTLGASAAALKRSDCCFQLTASGGASGTVGQLNDGQNRVGGQYGAAKYCINSEGGGITDANGRGCILTPPTTQFQCDEGASPTTGFSVGQGGEVTYNGSTQFYACPAADGEYNIYTKPVEDQAKCVEITLSTGGQCGKQSSASVPPPPPSASNPAVPNSPSAVTSTVTQTTTDCPSSSAPAGTPVQSPPPEHTTLTTTQAASTQTSVQSVPVPTPSAPASQPQPPQPSSPAPQPSTTPASQPTPSAPSSGGGGNGGCPTDLAGDYQYPHLVVPVNASTPSTAYGTQYNGDISSQPQVCSLFNFDIPDAWAGSTCSSIFLLPLKSELETSDYSLSGSGSGGKAVFKQLEAPAGEKTSWANKPAASGQLGSWGLEAGKKFVVETGECKAGRTVAYEICAQGGLDLEWFQDWNPSPIGLFVRKC